MFFSVFGSVYVFLCILSSANHTQSAMLKLLLTQLHPHSNPVFMLATDLISQCKIIDWEWLVWSGLWTLTWLAFASSQQLLILRYVHDVDIFVHFQRKHCGLWKHLCCHMFIPAMRACYYYLCSHVRWQCHLRECIVWSCLHSPAVCVICVTVYGSTFGNLGHCHSLG